MWRKEASFSSVTIVDIPDRSLEAFLERHKEDGSCWVPNTMNDMDLEVGSAKLSPQFFIQTFRHRVSHEILGWDIWERIKEDK